MKQLSTTDYLGHSTGPEKSQVRTLFRALLPKMVLNGPSAERRPSLPRKGESEVPFVTSQMDL